jgi:integrase
MARKYQRGSLVIRGARRKVYVLRYYESVLLPDRSLGRSRRSRILGTVSEIGTKRKAWEIAQTIMREANLSVERPEATLTFGHFAKLWEERILPLKKQSTQKFYRETLGRYMLPAFATMRLCDIEATDVQGFITAQSQRFAWATVQNIKLTLNQVLKQAVDWTYLRENPVARVKMPKRPPQVDKVILTPDQLKQLLLRLREPCHTVVATAIATGMRRCELFALRWCDVDFEKSVIHVRQRIYKGLVDTPKTPRSIRDLPIPTWLAEKLLQHRERRGGCPASYVFAGSSGKPLNPVSMCQRVLQPALSELGLPKASWHCFRRTLATWLSENGTQIKTTQELLGHSSVNTTLEYYVQSLTQSRREAIEMVGRLMDPNGPKFVGPVSPLLQ